MCRMRRLVYTALVAGSLLLATQRQPEPVAPPVAAVVPVEISAAQFNAYIESLSEPDGFFDTDNFISNETSYLHVVGELGSRFPPGTVYLGVGPDQNFSYIVHARPSLAIIIDIRRQNMLQHLLYKALFDLSRSRAEFLAVMFSREVPATRPTAPLRDLLRAIRQARSSDSRHQANLAAIQERLTKTYGLRLSAGDLRQIEYVYATLHEEGLDLRFSSLGRNNAANYPTFESLLLQTDMAGTPQGYLATEELFLRMKQFQAENRLIPVVGDFAGPRALRAVGELLRSRGLQVGAFYTSNVEFYLFGSSDWNAYTANLETLPLAPGALFIRSYFGNSGAHPRNVPGHRSTTLLQRMDTFIEDQKAGRLRSYTDIVFD